MATAGTTFEGMDNIIGPAVYTGLQLVLYENAADSLSSTTVLANLTLPTGETGYAAITLSGVWSFSNGIVTYDHGTPDDPQYENTGASNWTNPIIGVAITDGTYILHYRDNSSPITMVPGLIFKVDISTLVAI